MSKESSESSKNVALIPTTSFVLPSKILGEMLYRKKINHTVLTTYLNGSIDESESFIADGRKYKPYSGNNPLLIHNVIRFPSDVGNYKDRRALCTDILKFIRRYLELPSVLECIAVHYIFLTWVYDSFNELPYLRVRGDFGTGKTRFLNVIGALCYKPIMASGASTVAPLFHILHMIGGTLVLDEADFRFSSETADITKILNNGNAKGFPVLRCQQKENREFKPKAYNVYGPKIIASRGRYEDDALESRCITFDMQFVRKRKDVPHSLPKGFEAEATKLRNKLLAWRFHNYFKKHDLESFYSNLLSPRLNQIYAPLLCLIQDLAASAQVIKFAKAAGEQEKTDRGLKVEADVLTIIKQRIVNKKVLGIGQIASDFEKVFSKQYERKITASWMGGVVRQKLRLRTSKSNGRYIISDGQYDVLQNLYESFDIS